jgi:gamma-butyrobetaine dioxygenase
MTLAFDAREGRGQLRAEVATKGHGVARLTAGLEGRAATDPWGFAELLFGETPDMIERQPIRAVRGARSFAASAGAAPLHTDSQMLLGVPAHAQVLVCVRGAARGGASILVDAWAILDDVRACDPTLFTALLHTPRALRFYFGQVDGPTCSKRSGSLVFTHPPCADDPIGMRLQPYIARAPVIEHSLAAGEVLVVDNHRMLHGRRAFEGDRELTRVLAWLPTPLGVHPDANLRAALPDRAEGGLARGRLGVVLALLRGVPPGIVAAQSGVEEAVLYRWRNAAIAAASRALEGVGP